MIRTFVIGGRQTGKTHDILLRMLDGEDLVYVAPTIGRATSAYNQCLEILSERGTTWDDSVLRRFRERFKTWEQAADPRLIGAIRRPVVIDDLDEILEQIFGPTDTVTMRPSPNTHIKHYEGTPE